MSNVKNISQKPIKFLIVDSDKARQDILKKIIMQSQSTGVTFSYKVANSCRDGLEKLTSYNPDIIILDFDLEASELICAKIRTSKRKKYTPLLVISQNESPKNVVTAFDFGIDDFCSKVNLDVEMRSRISSAIRIKKMQRAILEDNLKLRQENRRLKLLTNIDELTGLSNMRYFKKRLAQEFSRAQRYEIDISLLMIDLDFFKNVNDSSNHLVGSHVLAEVGRLIESTLRRHDVGARFGGDEYVIILTQTNAAGALAVSKRLLNLISETVYKFEDVIARVTPSIGYSSYSPGGGKYKTGNDLLKCADENLYRAKNSGRACISGEGEISKPIRDYSDVKNRRIINEPESSESSETPKDPKKAS